MAPVGRPRALRAFLKHVADTACSQKKTGEEEGCAVESAAPVGSLPRLSIEEAVKEVGFTTWDRHVSGASTCLPPEDDLARAISQETSEAGELDAYEASFENAAVGAACSQERLVEEEGRVMENMVSGVSSLSIEEAVALQSELLEKYSQPEFQIKLSGIYAREDPRSLGYHQKLGALLHSAHAGVLPKYGFIADDRGDVDVAIALGEFHGHPEVDLLTIFTDDMLYGGEPPLVKHSKNLSKKQVLCICRAQVAAFKKPAFQAELERCSAASTPGARACMGRTSLRRCGKLALEERRPILREYGLEPNERGVHSLLHQVAQYIMDPQVVACVTAINLLLGMDTSACERFVERAQGISASDPCPRLAKETPMPLPPQPEPVQPITVSLERIERGWPPFRVTTPARRATV